MFNNYVYIANESQIEVLVDMDVLVITMLEDGFYTWKGIEIDSIEDYKKWNRFVNHIVRIVKLDKKLEKLGK